MLGTVTKILLLLFLAILQSQIAFANKNLDFNFSGIDIDGDEIYGYVIISDGPDVQIHQVDNYTTKIYDDGTIERIFFFNRSLEEGFYKFDIRVSSKEDFEQFTNQETTENLKYPFIVGPAPEISINQNVFVKITGEIYLEQTVIYKNNADNDFKSFPLYDGFRNLRNCINETYYKLDFAEIRDINLSSEPILVRKADIPAHGEKGFVVKCQVRKENQIIETYDGENALSWRLQFRRENESLIIEKSFRQNIFFPKKKDLFSEIVFTYIYPSNIPKDDGTNKIFEYTEDFTDKEIGVTDTRIYYKYVFPLDRLVTWFIALLAAFLVQEKLKDIRHNRKNQDGNKID